MVWILYLHFPITHLPIPVFPELIHLWLAELECQSEHSHIVCYSDHWNTVRNEVFSLYQIEKRSLVQLKH